MNAPPDYSLRATQALHNFGNALQRLTDGLQEPLDESSRDMVILRFMFTYETAWKAMKWILLSEHLIDASSPKQVLAKAYTLEWLGDNDAIWLAMAQDRNLVVHTYNQAQAEEIHSHIEKYAQAMTKTLDILVRDHPQLAATT